MPQQILDEIKDFDSKARKSLELLVELTVKKLAPLVTIDGTRMWQGQGYEPLSRATKEQLAEAEKLLEKNYELAAHLMCIIHTSCLTIRTAEAYRQKALSVSLPLAGGSKKMSEVDALLSIPEDQAQKLIEALKARLGVKANTEGKTL